MASRRWWIALAGFCVLIAVSSVPVLRAPFGDNRDGVNAGVWGLASRELRESWSVSRLGAYAPHRVPTTYVHHPPLVVPEVALIEAVAGERPWATRLAPLLATMAAAALLAIVLVEAGLTPPIAVAATALGFGCPLVRTYGAMVDTPIVGLPLGIATLLLWQRSRAGRPPPVWLWTVVVSISCLSSWLGWLLGGLVGVALLAERRWRDAAGVATGATAGAVAYAGWILYGAGGKADVLDIFLERTGDPATTGGGFFSSVGRFLASAFPPWALVLVVPLTVLALLDRRLRGLVVVAGVTSIVWETAFPDRAATQEFWLWWSVIPLTIAFAAGLDAALSRFSPGRAGRRFFLPVLCAVAGAGLFLPSPGWTTWRAGVGAGELVETASYPADQVSAWILTPDVKDLAWVGYATRRDMASLSTSDVPALAERRPDDLVLTPTARPGSRPGLPTPRCLRPDEREGTYALVTAARLASLIAALPSCP
jgi:hypothetical protein